MKCCRCNCEMLVDRVVEKADENKAEIIYKCPNKICDNYGFKNDESGEK